MDDDAHKDHRAAPKYERQCHYDPGAKVDKPAPVYLSTNEVTYDTKESCARRNHWQEQFALE